jgi:hypothetical protein
VGDGNAPPEAAFPDTSPPLTRVSRERDVFIDHKMYDAKIMNTFNLYRKHSEEPDLPALLSHASTLGDKRLLTVTPDVTREPSIKIVLQRAWKGGSFKEVRQLGVFGVQFLPILGA